MLPLSTTVVFAALCLSVGVLADEPDDVSKATGNSTSSITWGACDPLIVTNTAVTCGFFEVPLDYHDPSAGKGRLAVAKINATGKRLGSLFVNPGGPGGSGLDTLNTEGDLLTPLTGGLYDIVSWDPRGVGSLTIPGEIFCFDSPDEYNAFWNGTIELTGIQEAGNFTDKADIDALLALAPAMQEKYDELGRRCLRHPSGKYLRYVGTAATARDVVALADALDGPGSPINFVGVSYGTLLGAWLINMFPERVGRIILDGVINPTLIATNETAPVWAFDELVDSDKLYEGFLTGCALAGPDGCSIATSEGQSAADIDATIQALIQQAHEVDRANASLPVTSEIIRSGLFDVAYNLSDGVDFANTIWPQLVAGVQGELNVTSQLSRRSTTMTRRILRRDNDTNQQNLTRSYSAVAILCGDSVDLRGTYMSEVFEVIISASQSTSKMFAAFWPAEFYACPFWPVRAVERYQGPFNKTLASNVLVVSNTFDPVTPISGAKALKALLGDNATLIEQRGFGHTTFTEPDQCLNALVFQYLANGTLPQNNGTMVCDVDADFELFAGVNTAAILQAMGV
ncbi:TAP-like protein-domain-containing protein [Trametes polyzona]|nr:TAP-like protein-domain-containing protein [Trametes polyzona]